MCHSRDLLLWLSLVSALGCASSEDDATAPEAIASRPSAVLEQVRPSGPSTLAATGDMLWQFNASMETGRGSHTATLLTSGKVLVAGGYGTVSWVASAELYDPTTETFSGTGSLAVARSNHTATLLPSGKVLIAGGQGEGAALLASAELYDPTMATFSATGTLAGPRGRHAAALLPSGKVLLVGGYGASGEALATAELYDPVSGEIEPTGSLSAPRHA